MFNRIDNTAKHVIEVVARQVCDETPDTSYLEQEGFEDRLAEYKNGNFCFVGMQAKATISINGVLQKIFSGGLYGIESDSDYAYMKEMADEELVELTEILKDLGFGETEIKEKTLEF